MKGVEFMSTSVNTGLIWNRLKEERQDLCEAMLRVSCQTEKRRLDLMQSRLNQIDDTLDRVASGVFGFCRDCGVVLDETQIESDATLSRCGACEQVNGCSNADDLTDGMAISTRQPFDVIQVQTSHSSYRFLLIDPVTGRSLVEGGKYFSEPTEAIILGSSTRNAAFRSGWIGIGARLELWAVEQLISTSAVASVQVQRSIAEEVRSEVSAVYC
jgi:RNA polymerase-binding transcription factor DksA